MPNSTKPQSLAEMKEARVALESRLDAITSDETRELTIEDANEMKTLQRDIANATQAIRDAEAIEEARLIAIERRRRVERADRPKDSVEGAARHFSYTKFAREALAGRHEGLEQEIMEEGHREAKKAGHTGTLQNPLPASFLKVERAQDSITSNKGDDTIDNQMVALIPALRPKIMMAEMGATVLSGLTAPLDLPRQTTLMSAAWRKEKVAADETDASFDQINLSPKGLSAWASFTREIMFQSSIGIEQFVRGELENAVRRKLDSTFLIGDGQAEDPVGLLSTPNTNTVTTNGTITWGKVVEFWKNLALENADMENLAFYTNPHVAHLLMTTAKVSGTDSKMFMESPTDLLAGYPVRISTQVPNNIGTSPNNNKSALIFGNWKEAIVGQFAGIDLTVDPYSEAKKAMIDIVIHSWVSIPIWCD